MIYTNRKWINLRKKCTVRLLKSLNRTNKSGWTDGKMGYGMCGIEFGFVLFRVFSVLNLSSEFALCWISLRSFLCVDDQCTTAIGIFFWYFPLVFRFKYPHSMNFVWRICFCQWKQFVFLQRHPTCSWPFIHVRTMNRAHENTHTQINSKQANHFYQFWNSKMY